MQIGGAATFQSAVKSAVARGGPHGCRPQVSWTKHYEIPVHILGWPTLSARSISVENGYTIKRPITKIVEKRYILRSTDHFHFESILFKRIHANIFDIIFTFSFGITAAANV